MNIAQVLEKLTGVKKIGNGYLAFCPAHEDTLNRSLSFREDDGTLLIHCFVGCSYGEILKALNIEHETITPVQENIYDYTDANGELLYQSIRYYPKSFKQRHKSNGKWVWSLNGVKRVLFHLPQVLKAVKEDEMIYFVEGEKDCLNLGVYGLVATSCSGGASAKWQPQYTEALKDARIVIIPDNDKAGEEHAEKVAKVLYGWAKSLKVLHLGSKDITEWLKTNNPEELEKLWNNTKEYIPLGAVTRDEFNQLKGYLIYLSNKGRGGGNRYNTYSL